MADQPVVAPQAPTPALSNNEQQAKGGKKRKMLIAAVIAAVVVLGGSAGAYFGYVVPNKPENVLKVAIQNTLRQKQAKTSGTINLEDPTPGDSEIKALSAAFKIQGDIDKKVSSFETEISFGGVKLPVEGRMVNGSLFFKIGDLTSVEAAARISNPEIAEIIKLVGSKISNQWIEMDSAFMKQSGTDCFLDDGGLTEQDINMIGNAYSKHKAVKVKNSSSDTVNGQASTRYELTVDKSKIKDFAKSMKELPLVKKLNKCGEKLGQGNDVGSKAADDGEKAELEVSVWVNKSTKTINQMEVKINSKEAKGTVKATIEYGGVDVSKPAGAKPFIEVFSDLAPLFGFGGGGTDFSMPVPGSSEL